MSTNAESNPTEFPFHGRIFSGKADGLEIALASLDEDQKVKVFRRGSCAFGLPLSAANPADADFVGVFQMVGPLGPETPIYMSA